MFDLPWTPGGTPGMMEFGVPLYSPPRARYFDRVDTVTGTPEADTFEVEPLIARDPWLDDDTREPGQGRVIRKPGQGTAPPKERPQSSEVDILVYQEQERAIYLDGFQAPTARSSTYIEDFEPIEDSIIVDGGAGYVTIVSAENNIPMFAPGCIEIDGEWFCF